MSRDTASDPTINIKALAAASGLLFSVAVTFTLSAVGLALWEAIFFGVLYGLTTGAFLYRERSLTISYTSSGFTYQQEIERLEKSIHYYYEHSLTCLARFDAGTLLIDKVSPGFLLLLRIPPDLEVEGMSIVEILRVSSPSVESIVNDARSEVSDAPVHCLTVEDSEGNQFPLEINARYDSISHKIEAAFFASPLSLKESAGAADIIHEDLDRFRRGMYRRETRILELKEEVNQILKDSGKKPRYQFDTRSDVTDSSTAKETDGEETY